MHYSAECCWGHCVVAVKRGEGGRHRRVREWAGELGGDRGIQETLSVSNIIVDRLDVGWGRSEGGREGTEERVHVGQRLREDDKLRRAYT